MAGAGYKLFNTGDVLTAAQVNTYLQEQAVMVFASAAARTTALSGVLAEGMMSYLQDTNAVEVYDGSAWVSVGSTGDITGVTAGTGISGGGTSGTVTITNSMATEITAAGDIIIGTGSGTFDNLPIGTTGQILTADTTVSPYKVKWATAASSSSGLTLITSTTVSAATSKSVDNCFSSTYANYLVHIVFTTGAASNQDISFRLRVSSSDSNANYTNRRLIANQNGVSTDTDTLGTDEFYLGNLDNSYVNSISFNIYNPFATTYTSYYSMGSCFYSGFLQNITNTGNHKANTSYDGFTLLSGSNMTGTIRIYGYQNS